MIHNAHRSFLTGDLCPYVSEYTLDLNITKYPRYQVRNVTLPNVFLITYLAYVHFPVDKVPGKPIVNCIAFDHMCKMALALDIGTTACVGWLIVGTAATSLAWMSMVKPFVNTAPLEHWITDTDTPGNISLVRMVYFLESFADNPFFTFR